MSCDISPIDATLAEALQAVVAARKFPTGAGLEWAPVCLGVTERLGHIAAALDAADDQNSHYSEMRRKIAKIRAHLASYFATEPPFTVVRLAEIVSDPVGEGYDLEHALGVCKYVNALHKLVFVTSRTTDYPEPVFAEPKTNGDTTELVGKATEEISLVKIPWLDDVQILQQSDDSESSTTTEDQDITKHKIEEEDTPAECKKPKVDHNGVSAQNGTSSAPEKGEEANDATKK